MPSPLLYSVLVSDLARFSYRAQPRLSARRSKSLTSLSETLGTPAAGDCRRSGFLVLCASRAPSSNSNYSFYCCCVSPLSSTIHGGRPFCTIGNGQQLGLPLPCFGLQQLDVNARSSPSIVEDRATRCLAAPRECLPLDVPRSKTTALIHNYSPHRHFER